MTEAPDSLLDEQGSSSFINDIDLHFAMTESDDRAHGTVRLTPEIRTPSGRWPRISVLHTIADIAVGMSLYTLVQPAIPVTVDMSMRFVEAPTGDLLDLEVLLHKVGRTVQTAETSFRDHGTGALVAVGFQVFAATPDPAAFVGSSTRSMRTTGALAMPFADAVGLRVLGPGRTELDRGEGKGNAMGGIQGGLVVLLGEMAAESLAHEEVVELEVRYLRSVAEGPGRATATKIGAHLCRVEVRDPGRDDRLCSIMLVSTEARP